MPGYWPRSMAEPPILSWENLGLVQGSGWLFGNPETGGSTSISARATGSR